MTDGAGLESRLLPGGGARVAGVLSVDVENWRVDNGIDRTGWSEVLAGAPATARDDQTPHGETDDNDENGPEQTT